MILDNGTGDPERPLDLPDGVVAAGPGARVSTPADLFVNGDMRSGLSRAFLALDVTVMAVSMQPCPRGARLSLTVSYD